ncbi:MAG TPA: benzoate-CoA ligase family protein [Blastocatellia bacterium]|nr:benzoate-CoA ligase family protein [Blastocatellia bacterium]
MIPEKYNASTLIDANLEAGRGGKSAIHFGDERITYQNLFNRVCAMGRALRALGALREQRILLILGDSPAFPVAFFGAMRIGAVPVPINPLYKASDYRFFLEDSYARVVITEIAYLDKLSQALEGYDEGVSVIVAEGEAPNAYSMAELLEAHNGELPAAGVHRDDMAFWLYSSGSTGKPKGVVHLHQDIPATCDTYARHILRLTEDDVVFGRVLFHAYGLGGALSFPFNCGASTVLAPGRPTPRAILDVIERYRPTALFLVPTLYNAILNDEGAAARNLSSLRLCVSAAEPLAPETWRRWKETFGRIILDGIGSTELLHIFCSNTLEEHKPGSSGKPVPGYELRILGDDGRPVTGGETGNLFVKGASAAPYYWHQREKSCSTMQGDWTATGDRYRMDEEGFYWYEGRADDMLKVGGEWVSPIEMENALMEHPAVRESAVVGVPVEGVLRIRAVIIPASQHSIDPTLNDLLKAELQEWCKARLQRFQYPHIIDFVDDLPKTASGKIQRFKLREIV